MAGFPGDTIDSSFPAHDALCVTKPSRTEYRFVWDVHGFGELTQANGEYIESDQFKIKDEDDVESKWKVVLYPRGKSGADTGNLTIVLQLLNEPGIKIKVCTNVSLSGPKEKKFKSISTSTDHLFTGTKDEEHTMDKLASTDTLSKEFASPHDVLSIQLDMTLYGKLKSEYVATAAVDRQSMSLLSATGCTTRLARDIQKGFQSRKYSDMLIVVDDVELPCHRVILAARSPVFKAMLESNMKETTEKKIEILDLSAAIVEEMLNFIYSGATPDLEHKAEGLLEAAEKYQLDQLKMLCETSLIKSTTVENAIRRHALGERFNSSTLADSARNYLTQNINTDNADILLNQIKDMAAAYATNDN